MHMSRVWDNSTVRLVPVLQRVAIPGQLKSVNKSNVHVSGAPDGVGITAREKVRLSQMRAVIPYAGHKKVGYPCKHTHTHIYIYLYFFTQTAATQCTDKKEQKNGHKKNTLRPKT